MFGRRLMHEQTPARNFLLFRTDLFLHVQPDADLDRWRLGGDCAGWFYVRLLAIEGVRRVDDPLMADWGWTFAVAVDDVEVRVNVWDFPLDHCWLLGIEPRQRWFWRKHSAEKLQQARDGVGDALESILAADARFVRHQWFAENPFGVVREF